MKNAGISVFFSLLYTKFPFLLKYVILYVYKFRKCGVCGGNVVSGVVGQWAVPPKGGSLLATQRVSLFMTAHASSYICE